MTAHLLVAIAVLICITAIVLRLIAMSRSDDSAHWLTQRQVSGISYFFFLLLIVATFVPFYFSPAAGLFSLLFVIVLLVTFGESALRSAGTKIRSQQVEFLWILATAAKSGRPLAGEIEAYAKGLTGKRGRLLKVMSDRLQAGMPLTEILVHPGLLPSSAVMQINAGIMTHTLEETLSQAAIRATRELTEEHSSDYPGFGLAYPPVLIIVASLQISFIMYYIIPKFKKIFEDFGTGLPQITIVLIRISDWFVGYWPILALPVMVYIPIGICFLVSMAEYLGWPTFLRKFLGRWFVRIYTPDVMRALSRGLASNIPFEHILEPLATTTTVIKLRRALMKALDLIRNGTDNWQSLERVGILKSRESDILEVAQRIGNLPWALDLLANSIEQRRTFRLKATLEFLKPLFLLIIGLSIAFTVVAIFMPLVKLLHDLS